MMHLFSLCSAGHILSGPTRYGWRCLSP